MQVDKPYAKPYVLRGHDREVTAVAWCPTDPHSIATCGDDATIKLWSVQRPWPPAPPTYDPPQHQVSSCSLVQIVSFVIVRVSLGSHFCVLGCLRSPCEHMWTIWGCTWGLPGAPLGVRCGVLGGVVGVSWASPGGSLGSCVVALACDLGLLGVALQGGASAHDRRSCLKRPTNGMAICAMAVARLAHMVVTLSF